LQLVEIRGYDKLTPMKFNGHRTAFLFLAPATAFTCQGRLNSRNLAVPGICDFRFRIFNANSTTPGTAGYLPGARHTAIELFTPATIYFYH
jgi:hypothetical protein